MPLGWFVPVSPGTRLVTVGGAIAADIHGKNHHVDGSFCSHVLELTLVTPTGHGGGVAGVRPRPVLGHGRRHGPHRRHHPGHPADDPGRDQLHAGRHRTGARPRRGDGQDAHRRRRLPVLGGLDRLPVDRAAGSAARCSPAATTPGSRTCPPGCGGSPSRARAFVPRTLARVPLTPPERPAQPADRGGLQRVLVPQGPRHQVAKPHHMAGFFHPLDGVGDWNRLYGTRGFLQYQFVVPDDQSARRCAGSSSGSPR